MCRKNTVSVEKGEILKKVTSTKSETIENINPMSALISKLKMADPEIQHYVTALEAEI